MKKQFRRLLAQELVVAAVVDQVMEALVLVVVRVRVHHLACALAAPVRFEQILMVERRHASRGEAPAHRLELAHHLEHLDQAVRRHFRDDRPAARLHDNDTRRRELEQRLAQWRA